MDYNYFHEIVSSPNLNICSELQVFEAIATWIEYNEEDRRKHMFDLLKTVRLPLCSTKTLTEVIHPFCENCSDCNNLIKSTLREKKEGTTVLVCKTLNQNRCCMKEYISYNSDNEQWLGYPRVCERKEQDLSHSTPDVVNVEELKYEKYAYYIEYNSSSINVFYGNENKWTKIDLSHLANSNGNILKNFSTCLFMDLLFITGGSCYKNDKSLNYVIFLKTNTNVRGRNMRISRSCHTSTVFGGKIFVIGGRSGTQYSVEAYDRFKNEWEFMPELTEERWGHGSVAIGNKLYAIAGCTTQSCEVFDYTSYKFTRIKPFPRKLYSRFCETTRVKNEIIVKYAPIYNENSTLHADDILENTYVYNPHTDNWISKCVDSFRKSYFLKF